MSDVDLLLPLFG